MESKKTKILMFPWLAHGHIIPYLELAKRILKRQNFHIYFCTTSINFNSVQNFINNNNFLQNSIELVQLNLEPCPELPLHYHTTKNLPSNLIPTLIKAFKTSESSFHNIVDTIKPDLVIYDIFQTWAARLASSKGIPAVLFFTLPAARAAFLYHHYICSDVKFPFNELYFVDREKECQDSFVQFMHADGEKFDMIFNLSCDLVLMKTSRCFEGKYVDYVHEKCKKALVAVGPLVADSSEENLEIVEWLDKKDKHSTLYISYGSESFLCKEEIQEIAKALELCEDVNFIWVIRFPIEEKSVKIEDKIPIGFLDRVKHRGMVVEWAPQAQILAHPNCGGFVSHCGWSSINESVYYGVPVIAMPLNPMYFVDVRMAVGAGICVEIPRDENYVCKGEDIAKVINMVIYENIGHELRKKAGELGERMRGEEQQALDEATEQVWQLCLNKNGQASRP